MRILSKGFLALVVWVLSANLASAVVTVNLVIDAPNTSGTIVGNTVSDLVFGDTIVVLVEVDNTADADGILSLFTSIQFDSNKLSFVGGESVTQLLHEAPPFGPSLIVGTPPEQVFGQPAGTLVGLSFMAAFVGPTAEPGPEFATELVFTVIGHGTSNILQIYSPGDQSIVNGIWNDVDGSPELVFGPPLTVMTDIDGDLVLDSTDNCLIVANGPNELSNQVDTDQDGYGNPCDADFNQNGVLDAGDFAAIVSNFNTASELHDMNGNGVVDPSDFATVVSSFNAAPGPSGLACADATIDIAAGDPPCVPQEEANGLGTGTVGASRPPPRSEGQDERGRRTSEHP